MTSLDVAGLTVVTADGTVLVDHLSFTLAPGEVVALVGEPGAGAVMAGLALLDSATDVDVTGDVRVDDDELLVLSAVQRRRVRGARLGALFPDPREAFDPGLTLAENLMEVLVQGAGLEHGAATAALQHELTVAGVPEPFVTLYQRAGDLPRGILQRACVALAAASGCGIVVAESPTSHLDILDGADVRDLLRGLATERGVGVLLITEDIAEAAAIADRISLMYAGEVHEQGPSAALLDRPRGPYTRALLASMPRLDVPSRTHRASAGSQPGPRAGTRGCRFAERCPFAEDLCRHQRPDLRVVGDQTVRCHFAAEVTWQDRLDGYDRGAL